MIYRLELAMVVLFAACDPQLYADIMSSDAQSGAGQRIINVLAMLSVTLEQGVISGVYRNAFAKVEHWFGDYARRFQNEAVCYCVRRMTQPTIMMTYLSNKSQLCWLFV